MPYNPGDGGTPQYNLTYASLPLTLQGKGITSIVSHDRDPAMDLADVHDDIARIGSTGISDPADWGWFQEGYDKEPTDSPTAPPGGTHDTYVTHHNGPQYFGYLSNNLKEQTHFHGMGDFFNAIKRAKLSSNGGVYYLKGGYENIFGLKPTDPDPAAQANFLGDDDHPGYSDAQMSEANVALAIDAIAESPYWSNSAIVITWDDSEGYYDHVPPQLRVNLPGIGYTSDRPRVPLIVISPFAKTRTISHEDGDQASVVKLVDQIFGLEPLAAVPDELRARQEGLQKYDVSSLGPFDGDTTGIGTLLSAFDPQRLEGTKPPLPASYVYVPTSDILQLPAQSGIGCSTLGIVPTDVQLGLRDTPPSDFNPRPGTDPPEGAARRRPESRAIDD